MASELVNEEVLRATIQALKSVREPRFYRSERGYQGRLYGALQAAMDEDHVLDERTIIEMEYQKTLGTHAGLRQRPDIIIHIPAEDHGIRVNEGNLAVYALKLQSTTDRAQKDYAKLARMLESLDYHLAVFINVASTDTFGLEIPTQHRERIHSFAVRLVGEHPEVIHSFWQQGTLQQEVF